jgi:acetyl esterase/lipase
MSHHRLYFLLGVLLAGASLADARGAAPPAARLNPKAPPDVACIPGLVYGRAGKVRLLLDLAQPRKGSGPFPAVLVLHGGAWISGSRKSCLPIIVELARRGCVAVAADYRLAPRHRFPAQVHDAKCAVRWLKANAARYNIDPDRIAVLGYSAGGHLACLLGTTAGRRHLEGSGGHAGHSSKVQLVVAYYPVTDLLALRKSFLHALVLKKLLGQDTTTACTLASPISHADRCSAPTLLIHGTADLLVPVSQSRVFANKLNAAGVRVRLCCLDGAGHGFGSGPGSHDHAADRAALEFLTRHLGPKLAGRVSALQPPRHRVPCSLR